jgi:hypothetical protein
MHGVFDTHELEPSDGKTYLDLDSISCNFTVHQPPRRFTSTLFFLYWFVDWYILAEVIIFIWS